MIGRTFSFVFLLVFLPPIGQALKCSYGGTCDSTSNYYSDPPKSIGYKNCKESCVFFYCFIDDDDKYVKHGYGCREDFERLCRPYASSIKEYNKNGLNHGEKSHMYSCNDSYDCAINFERGLYKSVKALNRKVDPYAEKCIYDEDEEMVLTSGEIFFEEEESYFKKKHIVTSIGQALKCSYGGTCEPLRNFTSEPPKLNTYKNCKGSCVYFQCVIDGNKYIKHGYGCPEDFQRLCPHASNVIHDMEHFVVGENFFLFPCNNTENCAMKAAHIVAKKIQPILDEIDPFANETCVYDEDEQSIFASGDVFFEEEEPYLNKTYIAFFVCIIVIFFGPYVYYELVIG